MTEGQHEQLSQGFGNAFDDDEDDSTSTTTVRIVPIPEGEITVGQSGDPTVWDRDPLRDAVEQGALDGATIVKGEGGSNPHFPMDEQVPPENILGRVEEWTYEEGVGPVGQAPIVDEQMADRIDADLLEVSPDLFRSLGEFDDDRDAYPVEEIVGMPRITVLETGAAANASIETSMAEALAYNPEGSHPEEGDADADGGADGGADADREQLAGLYPLRFHGYGDFVGTEYIDEAVNNLDSIQGVTAVSSSGTDSPELLAVLDREAIEMDGLNESIVTALDDTPFEVFEDFDWLDRINREQLALDVSDVAEDGEDGGEEGTDGTDTTGDEAAESATDTDTESMSDEPSKQELQEQLAEAKAEINQKEEALQDTEETLDEIESEKEELETTVESKEEKIERLKNDTEHARRRLALEATGHNESAAEMLVDSERSMDDLAESAAAASDDIEVDEDSDESYVAQVEEQLAGRPAARGDSSDEDADGTPTGDGGGGGAPSEEQLAQGNDWAYEVLSGSDISSLAGDEQLSPRQLAKEKTGVDPAKCDSRAEFSRKAAAETGGDD